MESCDLYARSDREIGYSGSLDSQLKPRQVNLFSVKHETRNEYTEKMYRAVSYPRKFCLARRFLSSGSSKNGFLLVTRSSKSQICSQMLELVIWSLSLSRTCSKASRNALIFFMDLVMLSIIFYSYFCCFGAIVVFVNVVCIITPFYIIVVVSSPIISIIITITLDKI